MDTTINKTESPYRTLADLRAANAAAGNNWFSRGTMKWWKSRIESTLIRGRFFVTSEDEFALDGRTPARIYAVRYAKDDATIATVRSHIRHKDDARELIRAIVQGGHAKTGSGGRCITCGEYQENCGGTL